MRATWRRIFRILSSSYFTYLSKLNAKKVASAYCGQKAGEHWFYVRETIFVDGIFTHGDFKFFNIQIFLLLSIELWCEKKCYVHHSYLYLIRVHDIRIKITGCCKSLFIGLHLNHSFSRIRIIQWQSLKWQIFAHRLSDHETYNSVVVSTGLCSPR